MVLTHGFRAQADDNSLFIVQIGNDHAAAGTQQGQLNRAGIVQGDAADYPAAADRVLTGSGLSLSDIPVSTATTTTLFTDRAGNLAPADVDTDLQTVLTGFGRISSGGEVSVTQTGDGNAAFAAQVGINNVMAIDQQGDGHIGVHVQDGSGNNTTLRQIRNVGELATIGALVVIGDNHDFTLTLQDGAEAYVTRRGDGAAAGAQAITINGGVVTDSGGAFYTTVSPP